MKNRNSFKRKLRLWGWINIILCMSSSCTGPNYAPWGYSDNLGPENWGNLDPAYAVASKGQEQSPIDLQSRRISRMRLPSLNFEYDADSTIKVSNNGHTIIANVGWRDAKLNIGEDNLELLQFHFHTPSEHLFNGKQYPAELHLVHQGKNKALTVVGIFIAPGKNHEELDKIWAQLPEINTQNSHEAKPHKINDFDLNKLLPESRSSYRYQGSLTTPPCTEGVRWIVFLEPIEMSVQQIEKLSSIFSGAAFPDGNRRPIQPLNQRMIQADYSK